jgi:hypothetical protein
MGIREMFGGTGRRLTQDEVVELTNQFYVTLRAYFAEIRKDGDAQIRNREAFNRVRTLLEPGDGNNVTQNWANAYEVEQLLIHLFDDDTVSTELMVRTLEARSVLRTELGALYEAHAREIDNPPAGQAVDAATASLRRRALLARLVNDLQWRYIVNEATRRYTKLITGRTASLSVFALTLFVVAVLVIVAGKTNFSYGDLRLLWIAGLAGTWGATFSMLATLKSRLDNSRLDDLKLMKAVSLLLSRAAIGAGAASILFFFLLAGLLGGSAFPSLARARDDGPRAAPGAAAPAAAPAQPQSAAVPTPPAPSSAPATAGQTATGNQSAPARPDQPPAPPANNAALAATPQQGGAGSDRSSTSGGLPAPELALLIVWCFIAGFSEQLIPGLLASTEARASSPSPGTTDRFRPTTGTTTVQPPAGSQAQTAPPAPAPPAPAPQAPPRPAPAPMPASAKTPGEPAGV